MQFNAALRFITMVQNGEIPISKGMYIHLHIRIYIYECIRSYTYVHIRFGFICICLCIYEYIDEVYYDGPKWRNTYI
jgi:hypothetical protein